MILILHCHPLLLLPLPDPESPVRRGYHAETEHLCCASRMLRLLPTECVLVFRAEESTDEQVDHLGTIPVGAGFRPQLSVHKFQGHY